MKGALSSDLLPQMTSDWPQILHGVGNMALIQAYQISAKSEPKNWPTNEPFFVVAFKTSDEGSLTRSVYLYRSIRFQGPSLPLPRQITPTLWCP